MTEKKRESWDLSRFIQTLSYFEVAPPINWIQNLINNLSGKSPSNQNQPSGAKKVGVILVAGATGGVGKRVVKKLISQGYPVRCLVRDIDKARAILGDEVDLVLGDITQPETLSPLVVGNIQAVICCTAVRVQPVQGDTPERAKYYQGVQFYQPEIVGDTPERVEYQGVKNLVEATQKHLSLPGEKFIFDFTQPTADLKYIWGALDDVVMGGVSSSNMQLISGSALFSGNVSTANSGGFASIRTKNFDPAFNLSDYTGIKIRLRGDGQRYKLFLRTETVWDGVGYSYSFDTIANTWIDVEIPFADLVPVFRAKSVKDCPPIDRTKIRSFQFMLSKFEYDGALNPNFTPGLFTLEIESMKAYGAAKTPQFVLVSSAGVTRPGRPGINLDEEPPAVRLNDQLGGILTWKLKGEDSIRNSGIPYTIIRPCALTEEAGNKEIIVEQGDNIRGKISRDDVAEICLQALNQAQLCNVTFEVKSSDKQVGLVNWQSLFAHLQADN
ncbi:CIA30 family protein [Calothrix sp. 336/3]|uniref:CIA30 family protein n=1 Tax=Calothrix sp. 336/3 TaxID=1337936 RepID=UPI0004E2C0B3|nr:CIA30 family protein [Calothrix sp. 336/3]AKG20639.1 NADH:ubiquinone oxidoreductase [Calothrix sp. 336/3]